MILKHSSVDLMYEGSVASVFCVVM